MAQLSYVNGDATFPAGEGRKILVHCCNDKGAWGSGFVLAISKRWPEPEQQYRAMERHTLGTVGLVHVEPGIVLANLIGQTGTAKSEDGLPPIRYEALRKGFQRIVKWSSLATTTDPAPFSIHMPRLGSGLAGGDWALIEPLIKATFIRAGHNVTVYDFPGGVPFYDSREDL